MATKNKKTLFLVLGGVVLGGIITTIVIVNKNKEKKLNKNYGDSTSSSTSSTSSSTSSSKSLTDKISDWLSIGKSGAELAAGVGNAISSFGDKQNAEGYLPLEIGVFRKLKND